MDTLTAPDAGTVVTITAPYGHHSTPYGGRYAYITTTSTELKDYGYASGPRRYTTERRYICNVEDPKMAELFARHPELGQLVGSSNYPERSAA